MAQGSLSFTSASNSGSGTAHEVSSASGPGSTFSFLKIRSQNYCCYFPSIPNIIIYCNSQPGLPLHEAEGDGPRHVQDDGDQKLPLEGQVPEVHRRLGWYDHPVIIPRVEEGDGAAEALHELEYGEPSRGLLLECAAQYRGDLDNIGGKTQERLYFLYVF